MKEQSCHYHCLYKIIPKRFNQREFVITIIRRFELRFPPNFWDIMSLVIRLYRENLKSLTVKLTNHGIYCIFVVSGSIKNLFPINSVNIYFSKSIVNYIFSIFFQYIYKFGLPRIAYITFCVGTIYFPKIYRTVCSFLSMKSPVEMNSLLSKFLCYIALSVISPD